MTAPSLRLAELLAARLCHELASPLGTLTGMMEMLAEGGTAAAEARQIADEASIAARARLNLLRAAWSADAPAMDLDELRGLMEGLRVTRRVEVRLDGIRGGVLGPMVRLLLNVVLLATEALQGIGVVSIAGSQRSGLVARIEGPRAAWPEDFIAGLADPAEAWARATDNRTIQGPLTAILAHQPGTRMAFEEVAAGMIPPLRFRTE